MTIDFRTIDKKRLFELKLKGTEIDFGFIPKWRRRKFVRFIKENGLVVKFPGTGSHPTSYIVRHRFKYSATVSVRLTDYGLLEWPADILRHRHWNFAQGLFYTEIVEFTIAPNARKEFDYDYVIVDRDMVYGV